MKVFTILFFLAFFSCSNLISQTNLVNPDGTPMPGYQNPAAVKGSELSPGEMLTDRPIFQGNPRSITDEYGSYNFNAMLSGLGDATKYVTIPHDILFNQNFDGTVEAWIYPTNLTHGSTIISKGATAGTVGFYLGISTASGIYLRIGSTFYTYATAPALNTWSHIAATWSGGPAAFVVKIYVNGALVFTSASLAATWNLNSDPVLIGGNQAFTAGFFEGYIDEVRFWNPERTASQIAENRFTGLGDGAAANGSNALTSSSAYTGLVSSWTFNTGGGTAYDDIGGFNGTYAGGTGATYCTASSNPLPYNLALKLSGGANDYVTVPTNGVFNQTSDGSIDAWIKLSTVGVLQAICSKGTAFATHNFAFYITSSNKIGLNIGAHNYMSTGPAVFAADKWYHVAATWTGGPNFTVNLYVNGVLDYTSTFNLAMPTNSDPFIIGKYYSASGLFNGYIDELRMWNISLTPAQITKYMNLSCRSAGFPTSCVAAWNFDGNLLNFATTTGISGSFNTGGTNNGRLSGYSNENLTGALSNAFIAHPTVLNRTGATNPFPNGYNLKLSNKVIADNTTIKDTITFGSSRAITSVELFLAVQHSYVADLSITLTAPNGQSRSVVSGTGGTGDGIITFFVDGQTVCSTTGFFAPWSYLAGPAVAFGNFGSANMLGKWILTVTDAATGDPGILQSWGLRFNGDNITGVTPISAETPVKFELFQNYPNPFNPVTTIKYNIPANANVKITIFDILGRELKTLINQYQTTGSYKIDFDGSMYSSGVYFYKIEAGQYADVKRMNLIK